MSEGRFQEGQFWARCRQCGTWQEVAAAIKEADLYFEYWQAVFCCCGQEQTAWFTIDKVDDDVH
ncbi:MAG: hypothetical protein ACUVRZ_09905 [Desulfobacca sp.]|uniref:hypothetical protein n=1 Tax=Desulfobacca sp. TaxID=2067990 RepID=UPI004049D676